MTLNGPVRLGSTREEKHSYNVLVIHMKEFYDIPYRNIRIAVDCAYCFPSEPQAMKDQTDSELNRYKLIYQI